MFIKVKGFRGGHQATFFSGLLVPLPSQLAEAFRFGFHSIRAIEPDQGLGWKIRENRRKQRVKIRNQEFHSGKWNSFAQRLKQAFFPPPVHFQIAGSKVHLAQGIVQSRASQRKLFHRQYQHFLLRPLGALTGWIELTNRLQLVTVKLDPQRTRVTGGKQINDATPDTEVTALLHQRNILETPLNQVLEQRFPWEILTRHQIEI